MGYTAKQLASLVAAMVDEGIGYAEYAFDGELVDHDGDASQVPAEVPRRVTEGWDPFEQLEDAGPIKGIGDVEPRLIPRVVRDAMRFVVQLSLREAWAHTRAMRLNPHTAAMLRGGGAPAPGARFVGGKVRGRRDVGGLATAVTKLTR